MHHMPRNIAEQMDKDSYSSKTGQRPQDLASQTAGEQGVEAVVEDNQNLPASQAQSAEETRQLARERLESDGVGGQG